jgi:hypothetical protein
MKTTKIWAMSAALLAIAGAAQASLINRGNGMIYDTTQNITWMADMNYAKSSGFDKDGMLDWGIATQLAENLTYGGFTNWRLPTLSATGGELGHLFHVDLGMKAGESALNQTGDTAEQIANLALFSNIATSYWSSSIGPSGPDGNRAWLLATSGSGFLGPLAMYLSAFSVAVRDGDVAAAVPEPQTLALVLTALCAGLLARKGRPG